MVYIPTAISQAYLQIWRLDSYKGFLESFVRNHKGKTTLAHQRTKASQESWITNEAMAVYENATNIINQSYSILMNAIFNVAVIAWLIDPRALVWYSIVGGIVYVSQVLFRKRIALAAVSAQETRNELSGIILKAWDNIFIGNRVNFEDWWSRFEKKMKKARGAAVEYDFLKSKISSFTVLLVIVVIGIGNGLFLLGAKENVAAAAALMITFPRQLQTIQNVFAFFNYSLSWAGVRSQIQKMDESLDLSSCDGAAYIQWPEISVLDGNHVIQMSSLRDLESLLASRKSGRLTLRGRNGSGKSTALSLLSERTGDESVFLTSQTSDLIFLNEAVIKGSDGQRFSAAIHEILQRHQAKYLFLDEWDANLDEINLAIINEAIQQAAERLVVVETRHRAG